MRALLLASAVCLVVVVALSGCGGGGGGNRVDEVSTAATLPTATYLPLKVGNWWHYKTGTMTALETFKLTGTATAGTATFYVAKSSRPGGVACTLKSGWYRHSTAGLHYRATKTASELLILKPPLTTGAKWTSGGHGFKIIYSHVTYYGPFGVLAPCLVVEETVGTKKTRLVYAAGVGIVSDGGGIIAVDGGSNPPIGGTGGGESSSISLSSTSLRGGPAFLSTQLTQQAPGQSPTVRVSLSVPSDNSHLHGWLVFRAANNPSFLPLPPYLVAMLSGAQSRYSDNPTSSSETEDMQIAFQYNDGSGTQDADVTASFTHPAMVQGSRYFYRVRLINDTVPLAQQAKTVEPYIEANPDPRMISYASSAAGPVTFFTPPLPKAPASGASNLPTSGIAFKWQKSPGANEYIVQVFPATDPDGRNAPLFSSALIRTTGSSLTGATVAGPFKSNTTYYWRVGARQSADPLKPLDLRTGKSGWLYSSMRNFVIGTSLPPA